MRNISTPNSIAGSMSRVIVAKPGIICTDNFVFFKCLFAIVIISKSVNNDSPISIDDAPNPLPCPTSITSMPASSANIQYSSIFFSVN